MSMPNVACAAVALGLALGGCAATSTGSGTSTLHEFKVSFEAAQHQLDSIGVAVDFTLGHAGIKAVRRRATQLHALAGRAKLEASALDGLKPPTQYNTRLRVLGSTLIAVADDLVNISMAATEHNAPATEAAGDALQVDAANVRSADATESVALGLPAR
jgi:hypothetical protein